MAESNIISDTLLNEKNTIIDATQNAIINVAEDVSAVLSPTNQEISLTSPFYTEIEFWVGMSFVLVVIFFGKLAYKFIKSALIKKINNIASDIEEAIKLRDDAQIALSNYEKKTKNTDKEVAEIIAKAQKNIIAFEEKELRKLKINSEMKEKEIDQRISSSIDTVTKELKDLISTESINLVEKSIIKYATEEEHSKLIDDAIENLDKIEIKFR
jgi:F-type H+-transporting ATPase subunit b